MSRWPQWRVVRRCMLGLCLTGCKGLEPAPADLDGLIHYFWSWYGDGTDEQLAEGTRNLHTVVGEAFEELSDGSLSTLSADEVSLVGGPADDAAGATGVYMVNSFACTLSDLEAVVIHLEQAELYDGVYDSYERSYLSDVDAFTSGEVSTLEWEVDYAASILGTGYEATLHGGVRRVPIIDEEQSPFGPVLVSRSVLVAPAEFENDQKSLTQDYQLEIYYERQSGEILHTYGLWREADFGAGFSSSDEGVQRLLLNSLADWDAETERLCAEGLP